MAHRAGITTNLEETKFQLEQQFKNTRNWKSTDAFPTKKDAEEWERKVCSELNCKGLGPCSKQSGGKKPWYGFVFEHDGPK